MDGAAGNVQRRARYHGTGQALFVLVFKNMLITLVTLGVYLPWARTERRQYLWQNIEFDGHRLRYHGTGMEMFVGYLKVLAGYVVLIGLPTVLVKFDRIAGMIAQLVGFAILFPLIPLAIYGSRRYLLGRTSLRGVRFGMEPGARGFVGRFIGGYLLTLVTLGFYAPVWTNSLHRYVTDRTRYGSAAFQFRGQSLDAFKIGMKGFFLSVLTLGLYYPWYVAEMSRFRLENTYVQGARGRLDLTGTDVFWMIVASVLGTALTLGIAFPWVTTYVMRTMASKVSFVGPLDYAAVTQRGASGDATADGLADALDVGLQV